MCRCNGSAKIAGWGGTAPARGPVKIILRTTCMRMFKIGYFINSLIMISRIFSARKITYLCISPVCSNRMLTAMKVKTKRQGHALTLPVLIFDVG
jgi:hypothetical protein